jgi:hypothetical protein
MTNPLHDHARESLLTGADLIRAADEGVLSHPDAERLIEWALLQQKVSTGPNSQVAAPVKEAGAGLNPAMVAYYFGAMLMISACAWFLGDKWEMLGNKGVLITTVIYLGIAATVGFLLRSRGYLVGGGLLVTVAVSLMPLIVYSIEDMLGFWPKGDPGEYKNYYPMIHGSWIVMEVATIAAAAIALRWVRFGFLTAPMAFSLWFLSMDLAALILGENFYERNGRQWISIAVGLLTILIGYILDRVLHSRDAALSEDFAFWCYLFGLMAFWGGMTSMDSESELGRLIYLLINVALIAVAVKIRRSTFLVFGALGVHVYLGHLAYSVFKDSVLFPFVLALLGLSLILVTVFAQRFFFRRLGREPLTV